MNRHVLIVGASARAAAQSAVRSGWSPLAVDQFADADLQATCPVRRAPHYPHGLAAIAREFPNSPFIYTGALENHLEELQALAGERPLLGNDAAVVRAVRDPYRLHTHLAGLGLLMPELRSLKEPPRSGDWLVKPFRSAGGIGIRPLRDPTNAPTRSRFSSTAYYLQRRLEGVPIGALFLGSCRRATLLGVTRQLIGCEWAGAESFWYVGNIGPWIPPPAVTKQILQVGESLARAFGLVGLFGVDAIQRDDELWTLEVNPRYTAATEIVERMTGQPLFQLHVDASLGRDSLSAAVPAGPFPVMTHGKAILYARHPFSVSESFPWPPRSTGSGPFPLIADLPAGPGVVPGGMPVCTIFASGPTGTAVVDALREKAQRLFLAFADNRISDSRFKVGSQLAREPESHPEKGREK